MCPTMFGDVRSGRKPCAPWRRRSRRQRPYCNRNCNRAVFGLESLVITMVENAAFGPRRWPRMRHRAVQALLYVSSGSFSSPPRVAASIFSIMVAGSLA